MDVDSTLIEQEVIELLADHAGTRAEVAAVTERAMRGEIDFGASLRERVATLAGVPVAAFADVRARATFTPACGSSSPRPGTAAGRSRSSRAASRRSWPGSRPSSASRASARTGSRSPTGGSRAARRGRSSTARRRSAALREFAAELGLPLSATIAVGDGANDLDMIGAAGVGIAFAAKPVVREQAPYGVDGPRLDAVLAVVDQVDAAR